MKLHHCQAQGPTPGPTQGQGQGQGQGQDMVRSGQVRLTPTLTQKWDLSYTLKLVSTTTHHSPLTTTISK